MLGARVSTSTATATAAPLSSTSSSSRRAPAAPSSARLRRGADSQRGARTLGSAVSGRESSTTATVEASNGVAVNGAVANGAAVANGVKNGVAVVAAANGSSAAAAAASLNGKAIEVLTPAASSSSSSTEVVVMDPCEVGQLEACAQERLAERDAEEAAALLAREERQKAETRAGRGGGRGASANEAAAESSSSGSSGSSSEGQNKKVNTPYAAPGGRWGKFRRYSALQRTLQIWSFAVVFFFKLWLVGRKWTYPKKTGGMTPENVSSRRARLATWLREGLVKLGPTFIKVGQQFSTRVDVLSPEFVSELEKLQDNVPPFDSRAAVATVERNLGAPVAELFDEFDPEPIAAASLGQVHLARLNGERVVVKVQRPGLKQLFDIDLKNVRLLAKWLQAVDPKSDGAARDWVAIYDECSRILYQEIDYTLEGKSADRFRECFADTEWVKVPRVVWERTAPEVLTMEYAPGIKVNRAAELDAAGVDRALLARRTVESYLQQLLTHGFFHADPHPGNVAADAGAGGGRLIYYDFGMMGQIPTDVRGGLLELFYGVYQKDPDRCIDALVAMGVLVPGGDRTAVRRTAQFFLDSFQERLDAQRAEAAADPEKYRSGFKSEPTKEEKKAKRKQILASIGEDLLLASADKPFRFPATFTFVVRSFTVLDGIGKSLDPRFDITEIAAPYARNLLLEADQGGIPGGAKLKQELSKSFARQNRAVKNLFTGPNTIEDIGKTVTALERGDLKPRVRALEAERALERVAAMQRVTAAAVVASALVNVGTVCAVSALGGAAAAAFVAAGGAGLMVIANAFKVRTLEKKEAQLSGA